jgi:hypothetical protein
MKKIDRIRAAVSLDPQDQVEGLCAFMNSNGQWMPLVSADEARFQDIEKIAKVLARETGKTIQMVEFSERTVLSTIKPADNL